MSGILTQEWREEHVKAGDELLGRAEDLLVGPSAGPFPGEAIRNMAEALAAVAQAHYQAANVRARSLAPVYDLTIDGRPLHDSP